jgi:hypothetical protein
MTPKKKAIELIEKFKNYSYSGRDNDKECRFENAKRCALIAVDEVIDECRVGMDWWWQEVKQEIEKI